MERRKNFRNERRRSGSKGWGLDKENEFLKETLGAGRRVCGLKGKSEGWRDKMMAGSKKLEQDDVSKLRARVGWKES